MAQSLSAKGGWFPTYTRRAVAHEASLTRLQQRRGTRASATAEAVAEPAAEAAAAVPEADSEPPPPPLTAEHQQRNAQLAERLKGQLVLAPLTRGGHLPFRRLCTAWGAEVTMSEMAFARHLLKGDRKEQAILRRAPQEQLYGVQIATNAIGEGVAAGLRAAAAGADWVDLNCGCPIHEATRRGLGAALLRKPKKLARLVEGIAAQLPIPLTVKVRLGQSDDRINVHEVVALLQAAGAAAVTVHGRTMEQRYKRAADWRLIGEVAAAVEVPLIGNGDILTHYEARRRLADGSSIHAVMAGRGALIKPWIFQEFKEGRTLSPTAEDRVGIYRQLVCYMKEHFGTDERGKRSAFYFLPWHFDFFTRYRPLPEEAYGAMSQQQPLIGTRWESVACTELGESVEGLGPLERLLRCQNEACYGPIAEALWEAESDAAAVAALVQLAEGGGQLAQWEAEVAGGGARGGRGDDRDQREPQG